MPLRRIIFLLTGWICLVVGLVTWPLPIPIGIPLIIIALAILARESVLVREWLRRRRALNPAFDRRVRNMRARLPEKLRDIIDITDPHPEGGPKQGEAGSGS